MKITKVSCKEFDILWHLWNLQKFQRKMKEGALLVFAKKASETS